MVLEQPLWVWDGLGMLKHFAAEKLLMLSFGSSGTIETIDRTISTLCEMQVVGTIIFSNCTSFPQESLAS